MTQINVRSPRGAQLGKGRPTTSMRSRPCEQGVCGGMGRATLRKECDCRRTPWRKLKSGYTDSLWISCFIREPLWTLCHHLGSPWGGRAATGWAGCGRAGWHGPGLQTTGRLVGSQRENQTNQPGKRTYKHTNERASYPNERTDGQTQNTINDTAALDGINKRNSGLL